jgi:hypothetical protein
MARRDRNISANGWEMSDKWFHPKMRSQWVKLLNWESKIKLIGLLN